MYRILTNQGYVVCTYSILKMELKAAPSSVPSFAYTFTDEVKEATTYESLDHAMTAFRCAKFKRPYLELIEFKQ